MQILYTAGDIAKKCYIAAQTVKLDLAKGRIAQSAETRGGIKLFSQEEVRRYADERRKAEQKP